MKFNFWEIVWAARVGVGLARVSWSWSCSGWLYHSSFPYADSWYPHNSSSTSWRTNYQTREQCENLKGDSHCPVVPLRTFFSIIEPYWIQNFRLLNPQFGPWNPRVWLIIYMLRTFKNHVSPYVPSFCKAKSLKKTHVDGEIMLNHPWSSICLEKMSRRKTLPNRSAFGRDSLVVVWRRGCGRWCQRNPRSWAEARLVTCHRDWVALTCFNRQIYHPVNYCK